VTGMNLNAFIRHAKSVQMANLTMLVTPIQISPDGLVLQTIFYPFELYRKTCGQKSLDVYRDGDTFDGTGEGRNFTNVSTLDVAATLDESHKQLTIYVINRSQTDSLETTISLADGQFIDPVQIYVINGKDIKTENTFENPNQVRVRRDTLRVTGKSMIYPFEPHSITALVCPIG